MTVTSEPRTREFSPHDISTIDFWAQTADEREQTFKLLRDAGPISWHRPIEGGLMMPENDGVWVVPRHAEIEYVSKHPELFRSGQGVFFEEVPDDVLEAASSFLAMDAPRHFLIRKLVSSAFTPRQVAKIEDQIRFQAKSIVDDLLDTESGDFVTQVSMRLPMWTISEMMGLPAEHRELQAHGADSMVAWNDPDVAAGRDPGEVLTEALVSLLTLGMEFADFRRKNPADDIMTNIVNAEVDGYRLTDEEIGALFVLLSVAGNDTTRNSITMGMKAFCDFPDQRQLLLEDFDGRIGTAMDEMVRWASPVMTFRRTATQDTVLAGQPIAEGEWVAMIYSSGNRDDRVFERPYEFDITRDPNPHQGFGGGGPHFCMGNFVAKMQLRATFDQLLHRAPNLQVGEPSYLVSNFVHAVKTMPYTLG
jgi:cytochrome P450